MRCGLPWLAAGAWASDLLGAKPAAAPSPNAAAPPNTARRLSVGPAGTRTGCSQHTQPRKE